MMDPPGAKVADLAAWMGAQRRTSNIPASESEKNQVGPVLRIRCGRNTRSLTFECRNVQSSDVPAHNLSNRVPAREDEVVDGPNGLDDLLKTRKILSVDDDTFNGLVVRRVRTEPLNSLVDFGRG